MKRLLIIFSLFVSCYAHATAPALTNVTATLTDSTGQVWANGTWRVEFIPPFGNPSPPNNNGNPITPPQTGVMDGTGTLTVTLDDNIVVAPAGTLWKFTLCPNANPASCSFSSQVVHGATQNLSASISADLTPVAVNANPTLARAYTDAEVTAGFGAQYIRVTDGHLRICAIAFCAGTGFVDATSQTNNPTFTGLTTVDDLQVNNNMNVDGTGTINILHVLTTSTFDGLASFKNCINLVAALLDFTNICPTAGGPFALSTPPVSGILSAGAVLPIVQDASGNMTCPTCQTGLDAVTSVFGRLGDVVAAIGDYNVSQVTGAAPLASPVFTGDPQVPTAAPGDNDTSAASTAFVQNALGSSGTFNNTGHVTIGTAVFQWVRGALSGSGEGTQVENWDITWPTAALNVQVSYLEDTSSGSDDCWYQVVSFTTTQVTIRKQGTGGTCQDSRPLIFAIGH